MKDVGIMTAPSLSAAEAAVDYLLQRIQHDVDLRYLMVGTESYHRLCAARASRTGEDIEAIKTRFLTPPKHLAGERPRIPTLQRQIAELEKQLSLAQIAEDRVTEMQAVEDPLPDAIYEALDLCPACIGIPANSINRCPMCRRLLEAIA